MSSTTNTVYNKSSLITMLPSEPSICIPRLFMNIQKERVYDVFADLFGSNAIERVDMIERKNETGEEYKRAFVHFKSWPRTEQATEVRLKLLNGDEVKIVYDQPWFWRISASRVPRPEDVPRQRRNERDESRPFIVIDDDATKDTRRTPYQPRQQHTQDSRNDRRQHRPHQYERREQEHHRQERYYDDRERRAQQPRYESRDRDPRDYHRSQSRHQEQRYDDRSSYTRRLDSRRPPNIHITPTKTEPEIADWIEKSARQQQVPGAPVKGGGGKKPRLVIEDADVAEGEQTVDVKSKRKLAFDETSSTADETQEERTSTTTTTTTTD